MAVQYLRSGITNLILEESSIWSNLSFLLFAFFDLLRRTLNGIIFHYDERFLVYPRHIKLCRFLRIITLVSNCQSVSHFLFAFLFNSHQLIFVFWKLRINQLSSIARCFGARLLLLCFFLWNAAVDTHWRHGENYLET